MPNVSACILSYNRPEYLCTAIDSILRQTVKPSEIIILDNGSNPNVHESVLPYLDSGVTWIGSDVNHSAAWNFQRALSLSKSEYLFALHDDDRLCDDFVEQQIDFLKRNPDVGAVTCNGYLINEFGNRTGRLLRGDNLECEVEFYRSSAAVAIRYASDSCLPFSPVVYRAEFVKGRSLREEFGKVVDAVFFCDLAKFGELAYQMRPLYECRVHSGQDSSYFPTAEINRLSDYFEDETDGSAAERKELRYRLVRQYTSHQLIRTYRAIFPCFRLSSLLAELRGVMHRKFSFIMAIRICVEVLRKKSKSTAK
jgi:glycosyltransferase involved in cell wall biosynthesis